MVDRSAQKGRLHSLELRLPPLPHTLPEVLDMLNSPGALDAEAMTEIVQQDPAIVARLLRQINSAYYGLRRSVSSVERAIRMMGPTTAAGTVIGLSMLKLRNLADEQARACFTRLIQHSVSTAFLTRFLLKQLPAPPKGAGEDFASDGFTEGLLHDFGKMVLVYNHPEEAIALYEKRSIQERLTDSDERALEQLVFGYDHTEAGAYAASKLHFPTDLVDVIRHHHTPVSFPGSAAEARCLWSVCAANYTTQAMGEPFIGSRASQSALDWETCASHSVWAHWRGESNAAPRQTARLMQTLQAKKEDLTLRIGEFMNPGEVSSPASL